MALVQPRKRSDRKKRHVCGLPTGALEVLHDYALMIEEIETAAGNVPTRRRGKEGEPAHSTMDYVLAQAITKALAKDPDFVKWQEARRTVDAAAAATLTSTPTKP
jgi:hypothetical protein